MTIAALEQAITFLSRTDLIVTARQQPLPSGVTDLLKISSGDNETLLAAQESSRRSQEDVRHASEFYVQQILFAPESDHYRVLGVDPDDSEAKIKLHYRLLVRWLHPDKNSSDWEAVFSERINRAWHALRTPERRREYDEQLVSEQAHGMQVMPSRELKPAQWRENKSDARFMSARTIKRLPVMVFSLLGVGAILVLWWFSQMQPRLQPANEEASQPPQTETSQGSGTAISEPSSLPSTDVVAANTQNEMEVVPTDTVVSSEAPAAVLSAPDTEPPAPPAEMLATVKTTTPLPVKLPPTPVVTQTKQKLPDKTVLQTKPAASILIANNDKAASKTNRKNRNSVAAVEAASVNETETTAVAPAPVSVPTAAMRENTAELASDASVRQFLQRFSRVYVEGDYFALHNLFTRDLSILGAPPQRNVLRSYRELFENSETREISLDHVTWLTSDEHIVVIASYQAQVLPRGKSEAQSSRGDIRLDLRVENGQLRIIRLQSDTKNG